MGKKIEVKSVLEVLQQEIDFHKDGAPKLNAPPPQWAAGFIEGLEQAKKLITAIIAVVEQEDQQ